MGIINFSFQTEKLSKEITNVLDEENINKIAKETGFVQRERKLNGVNFLDMLLFTHFNHNELSLNDLSAQLAERYNIEITAQSIDERFTNSAVIFFKTVLKNILRNMLSCELKIDITKYDKVKIKDSTSFQLPENMQNKYAGSGGASSKASIRIQFEYDLKNGEITDLSLHSFSNQDMTNAGDTISDIRNNELIIRDLGYVAIKYLKNIQEQSAFYLNRLHSNVNTYELKGKDYIKIDFAKLHKRMSLDSLTVIEKNIYIGKEKFPTRMIIELLPKKKYEERIRKAKRKANRNGRNVGKNVKARMALNIFITNTDIPAKDVRTLYTLRWQIELMFKIWKSIGEIHKVKKMKVERFEAYLFAKLIWIVINWKIMWKIIIYFFKNHKINISPYKLFKTLKNRLLNFRKAIYSGHKYLQEYIESVIQISPRNHKSEKKKSSTNWFYEVIEIFKPKDTETQQITSLT